MKKLLLLLSAVGMIFTACDGGGLDEGGSSIDPNNPLNNKKCASNEVLYISKSCLPMELNNYDGWGAKLVSNTYENGVGRLKFDATVTAIASDAFKDNSLLEYIKMPNSVTSIGSYAFQNCESLKSITIGNGVTEIEKCAFSDCTSLTSVEISDLSAWCKISFGGYGANPLYYAKKLYLNGSELTYITIPSDITEIKAYAFYGWTSLKSITISDGVTSIGDYAFQGCTSLTSVTIPDSVTSIEWGAFYGCTSLKSITIPNAVTEIGGNAFNGCTSLTSVTIGNRVTSIGSYAFSGCSSLTSVYCKPTTPPAGEWSMFYNNASGRKIYVPRNSVEAYKTASGWSRYASDIEGYDF